MSKDTNDTIDSDVEVWVDIGEIGKTHGLRGEVSLHLFCDDPDQFRPKSEVFLLYRGKRSPLVIASIRKMAKKLVVRFEGYDQIDDIKPLVGSTLQVKAEALPALGEDENYHFELIGLKVYQANGEYLGILREILSTAGNDVYCVRHQGRETLIPAIKDVIESVDLATGRMTLKDMEGLIEP